MSQQERKYDPKPISTNPTNCVKQSTMSEAKKEQYTRNITGAILSRKNKNTKK